MGEWDHLYVSLFRTPLEPESIVVGQYEYENGELITLAENAGSDAEMTAALAPFYASHAVLQLKSDADPSQGQWTFFAPPAGPLSVVEFVDIIFASHAPTPQRLQ